MHTNREEHVSIWHPWLDKPGQRHTLDLWNNYQFNNVEQMIATIGGGKKYAFCNDILQQKEVDPALVMMSTKRDKPKYVESYISRTGAMTALKVRHGRNIGFLIPGIIWGDAKDQPTQELLDTIGSTFRLFDFEALTPPSLSEKVLRATLPDKTIISRPCKSLRASIIEHSPGGRQDAYKGTATYYREIREYDIIKAYLHFSRYVVSPFLSPIHFTTSDIWVDSPTAWLEITMTAYGRGVQPIQIKDKNTGDMREPKNGETFTRWLWREEIFDCLAAGYVIREVIHGYAFRALSNFMEEWSDVLWDKYSQCRDNAVRDVIKKMMVGLPGRFLKRPETYSLVHRSEKKPGDMPVLANWQGNESPLTDWYIRTEYDLNSAQLTHVGAYIIMKCRQEIYRLQKEEERAGNEIISAYTDNIRTVYPLSQSHLLGKERGQYKETIWQDVIVEGNRILGVENGQAKLKAPGIPLGTPEQPSVFRVALEQEMRKQSWPYNSSRSL